MPSSLTCRCFDSTDLRSARAELAVHRDRQDESTDGWRQLLALIDRAAADGRETFDPAAELGWNTWGAIRVLPPTIGRLNRVRRLALFGSGLVRLPVEIGQMTALADLDTYTSYRLHWYPYEITRCRHLHQSRVSTRALYGNRKFRPPFPPLPVPVDGQPSKCSVCDGLIIGNARQMWITLQVAADALPLLVHACSDACIERLPAPPQGYVPRSHVGGRDLLQPPAIR